MPRKGKTTEPVIDHNAASATALAEQDHTRIHQETPGFADRFGKPAERTVTPDPFKIAGDYLAGVHLFESRQDRQVALKFDERPSEQVIDKLKFANFRWSPTDRVWAHAVDQGSAMSIRIDAERLFQEVRQMIRQEKGLDIGQEVPF